MDVVCFSLFLPHRGVDNAGAEFVRRHIELLGPRRLTFVFPGNEDNASADRRGVQSLGEQRIALKTSRWWRSKLLTPLRGVAAMVSGPTYGADLLREAKRSKTLHEALSTSEIVELHWTEASAFLSTVRKHAPNAKVVLICHDVIAQQLDRKAASMRGPRRWYWRIRGRFWGSKERRAINEVDGVVVLSDKDGDLVKSVATPRALLVADPPLNDPRMPSSQAELHRRPASLNVLFTGAFQRSENSSAAIWFLTRCWPLILAAVPGATLTLAGAKPPTDMLEVVAATEGAEATGYVEDLATYYLTAGVVVVPLLRGAGIKFKSIDAMLWGCPVVSTSIGAEGLVESNFVEIADDPTLFAAAVSRVLLDPGSESGRIEEAWRYAHRKFGGSNYARRFHTFYRQLGSQ